MSRNEKKGPVVKTKKFYVMKDCYAGKVIRKQGEIVELPADTPEDEINQHFHDLSKGEVPEAGQPRQPAIVPEKLRRKQVLDDKEKAPKPGASEGAGEQA